jgi:hypothetical protein
VITMATTRSLREELIRAWELVSYVLRQAAGGDDLYPFGDTPEGIIRYTPDGFMSAQLMRPDRPEFASWFDATDDELQAAARGYIAYSGPFHVDGNGILTHKVWVCLYPNWIGQSQTRVADLRGDTLVLSTPAPMRLQGKDVYAYLTWRGAKTPTQS